MIELILGLLVYIVTFYMEYINLKSISNNKKKTNYEDMFCIVIVTAINYYLTLSGIIPLKMIISYLSLFFMAKFLIKLNYNRSIICSLMYYILLSSFEYILSIVLVDILKYDPSKYIINVGIQKAIIGTVIIVIMYLICRLSVINKIYSKFVNGMEKLGLNNIKTLYFLLIIFLLQVVYIFSIVGKMDVKYTVIYIFIVISSIIYIVISMYQRNNLKIFNKYLIEKDEYTQGMLDEYMMFKHNIKHELLAINSIGDSKVKEMISGFIEEYGSEINIKDNITKLPKGLKGMIYQKLVTNKKINQRIIVDNYLEKDPCEILDLKKYMKFIESIGIITDNAIEYGDDSYIYIYINYDKNNIYFRCINELKKDIDVDYLNEEKKVGKGKNMGIGLYYIRKKTNFDLKIRIKNNTYITELKVEI